MAGYHAQQIHDDQKVCPSVLVRRSLQFVVLFNHLLRLIYTMLCVEGYVHQIIL